MCREIYADVVTPITLLRKLAQVDSRFFLLESVEGGNRWGRYSFLGVNPLMQISAKDGVVTLKSGAIEQREEKEPMEVLREQLSKFKTPKLSGMPSFTGGFVGHFSYEMIGYAEPKLHLKKSGFDDYNLMLFDKVIAYDHLKQKIIVVVNYRSSRKETGYNAATLEIEKIIHMIYDATALKPEEAQKEVNFTCNTSKEEYCEMVEKTKRYIREGDIFQGVISRRFEAEYRSSLLNTYRVLRTTNPSPYMYFIQCDDLQIAGTSPETMVKLEEGKLTTFPVAGTRKRGADAKEDELEKLPKQIPVARYHSLAAQPESLPDCLKVIGTTEDGEIMAVRHKEYKIYGLQFHPESVLTPDGEKILRNFLMADKAL